MMVLLINPGWRIPVKAGGMTFSTVTWAGVEGVSEEPPKVWITRLISRYSDGNTNHD